MFERESELKWNCIFNVLDLRVAEFDLQSLNVILELANFVTPKDWEYVGLFLHQVRDCNCYAVNHLHLNLAMLNYTCTDIIRTDLVAHLLQCGTCILFLFISFPIGREVVTSQGTLSLAFLFFSVGPELALAEDVPWCEGHTIRLAEWKDLSLDVA